MKKRIISIIAAICMMLTVLPIIGSAADALTLTKTVNGNSGAVITVSGGSGTVTAASSNTGVATVAVSGTTVTVTGVSGAKGIVTVTVNRGSASAKMEVAIGYTAFVFNGRSVTVYEGSDVNYAVVGIETASETEFTGAEGTGEMTVTTDSNGNSVYTVASGYELCVGIKKKGGIYSFSGSTQYANIVVKKEATKDATILLDGLNLKSQFTSAIAINKDSKAKVYIDTLLGTVNTLADSALNNADTYGPTTDGGDGSNQYYAESAVVKGKTASNVTFAGKGKLTITAAAKNGVKVGANGYLTVAEGTLTVTAPNSALSVENEMLISGGTIALTSTAGDTIKAEDDTEMTGTVYITGGDITMNSADEGILVRGALYISGGSIDVTCVGDGLKAENADATMGDIEITGGDFIITSTGDGISAFDLEIDGGTFGITGANGYNNTSFNGDTSSAKCLKAELDMTIAGGTFNLSTPDDAIHSDGNITIAGGTIDIWARDDGFHADHIMTFGMRGASDELIHATVNFCYEGVEGADIILNSGYLTVKSQDDTINAANKNLSNYHYTINVYGGVYRLYTPATTQTINGESGGDGVDSNGGTYFYGGDLEVYSKSGTSNDPLDSEDTLGLYNGTVLGCGQNAMQGNPTGVYVQFTNLSIKSGYSIVIKDGSGNVLKSTTAWFASSSNTATYIVFSHPALVSGNTYYCYINGSSSAKTGTATGTHVDNVPWTDLDAGNTNVYDRVTSMGAGSRYIITNASASSPVYTLSGSTSVSAQQSTMSSVSGGYTFGTVNENNTWYMDSSSHLYNTVNGVNYYLYYTTSSSGWSSSYTLGKTTDVNSATSWIVTASGTACAITTAVSGGGGQPGMSTTLYLSYSNGWRISTTSGTCYVYAPSVAQAALIGATYYVAENDENFGIADIQAGTSISYRSSRSATATNVPWSSSHITYTWEPAYNNSVNGTYVMTVMYDGVAFGTITVRIVGEDQSIIVNFVGDYVATVESVAGELILLPTAPEGFVYVFYVNGMEFDGSTPLYQNTTITVVMEEVETPTGYLAGDIDCNGIVNMADLALAAAYVQNSGTVLENGIVNGDMNGDGALTAADLASLYSLILS
jgi:hypothetical protein